MSGVIGYILCFLVGGTMGYFSGALMVTARLEDEWMDKDFESYKSWKEEE
jgi:hypothetical protein